jgi:hypothetical protein
MSSSILDLIAYIVKNATKNISKKIEIQQEKVEREQRQKDSVVIESRRLE